MSTLPFTESVGYQIRTTHRMIQRYLQTKIEPYGVTLGMWYFLRVLWDEEGLTQRELSGIVGTMEPTTLSALRAMERSGFIRRQRSQDDGRKINIYLTDEGRALEKKLLPMARQVLHDATKGMTEAGRRNLLRSLARIQHNIQTCASDAVGATDEP